MNNSTSTIHTYYSSSPSYKIESRKNNRGIEFKYIEGNPLLTYMVIPLGLIFLSLLDDVSFWAIVIFLGIIVITVFWDYTLKNIVLIFDTKENQFYRFNKKNKEKSDVTSFTRITAIQILHYIHTTTHSDDDDDGFNDSYETHDDAYELNLVLENSRINIEANSDYKSIQKHARRVARLLDVAIVEVEKE